MRFEELLTPYVQNRLDKTERQFVEELAKADSELNKKLQFEIQLANQIQQTTKEFKEVTPSFHELKQRIESTSNKFNWLNVFSWDKGKTLGGFNPSLVVASLAIVCVGVYMLFSQHIDNRIDGNYETLSTNDSVISHKNDRQYLRIVVTEGLTESQVQTLSNELIFNIESGPDSMNSYVISVAEKDTNLEDTITHWREDPRLRFIEPLPSTNVEP